MSSINKRFDARHLRDQLDSIESVGLIQSDIRLGVNPLVEALPSDPAAVADYWPESNIVTRLNLLMDMSGSMNCEAPTNSSNFKQSRREVAVQSMNKLLEFFRNERLVTPLTVGFENIYGQQFRSAEDIRDVQDVKLEEFITSGANTPLLSGIVGGGLRAMYDQLEQSRMGVTLLNFVAIATDGQENVNRALQPEVAAFVRQMHGLTGFFVLGLPSGPNAEQALLNAGIDPQWVLPNDGSFEQTAKQFLRLAQIVSSSSSSVKALEENKSGGMPFEVSASGDAPLHGFEMVSQDGGPVFSTDGGRDSDDEAA